MKPMEWYIRGFEQQMQLWFTKADVSATAVMSETAKGFNETVTMRDVLLNYPYANQLCRVKLTGKELRHIIEHSAGFLKKDKDGKISFIDRWIKPKPMLFNSSSCLKTFSGVSFKNISPSFKQITLSAR